MEVININVNELTPYENNPRNNNEAIQYVANSIKEFGFKVPLVIENEWRLLVHISLNSIMKVNAVTYTAIIG